MVKFFALALIALGTAHAQQAVTDIRAGSPSSTYLQDARGVVVRSGSGMCWRGGAWTPADALPGCDGELAPPVTKAIAPPLASTAPAPQPPAPIAPPRRCDFTVTLAGDDTFGFGRAGLRHAGKQKLEREVMRRLADCSTIESILVTGHADKIGSQRSNQRLSEQRAAAVADFLKNTGLTLPVDTRGAGSGQPVKTCSDRLSTARLRACLAPNRRVVVDVRGVSK